MTTQECFDAAVRIETLFRDVYAGLARRFGHRSDLRDLFLRLADEEEQHAQRIRLLARRQSEAAWDPDVLSELAWGLDAIAAELLGLEREFDVAGEKDVPAILRRVIDLEGRAGAFHAEELARSGDPEISGFFSALSQQDERHKDLLQHTLVA
jgi:rubrerythrin